MIINSLSPPGFHLMGWKVALDKVKRSKWTAIGFSAAAAILAEFSDEIQRHKQLHWAN